MQRLHILTALAVAALSGAAMCTPASAAPPATDCGVDFGTGGTEGGGSAEPSPVTPEVVTDPPASTPVDTSPVDTSPYDPCIAYSGAPETTGSGLPTTGSTSTGLAVAAAGLTAVGAGLALASRRRRPANS